ncbi:MAG: hypothetical protein ABIO79_08370, partial [Ferruginibacter sp.]
MKKIFLLSLASFYLLTVAAQSAGDYRSVGSGSWSDPLKWERFNGSTWISPAPSGPSYVDGLITVRSGHTIAIDNSVTLDQTIVEAGSTISLTSTLSIANGVGDDIIVGGIFTFISGQIGGAGTMNVTGSMDWRSGFVSSNIIMAAGSHSSKSTSGVATISGNGSLNNNGELIWSDGNFSMQDGTFNNNATGQLIATGNNSLGGVAGSVVFNNAGSFTKQTGTGITTLTTGGTNTGSINVNEGTISSTSNYENSGSINIAAGKTFLINGGTFKLNNGTNITGQGNFQHVAGNLGITADAATPANVSNFLFTSGVVGGAGTLLVNGGMDWRSGSC